MRELWLIGKRGDSLAEWAAKVLSEQLHARLLVVQDDPRRASMLANGKDYPVVVVTEEKQVVGRATVEELLA